MHHYRSREDETSCATGGGSSDPYFYLRLSAGSTSPYCGNSAAIKLEVDVKPELPRMTPVVPCGLQMQQQASPSESAAVAMDAGVRIKDEEHQQLRQDGGSTTATGIGLLALTQLDGYGGGAAFKSAYCDVDEDPHGVAQTLHHIASATDLLQRDKDDKYSFGRQLIYPSPDDIKHQVLHYITFLFSRVRSTASAVDVVTIFIDRSILSSTIV